MSYAADAATVQKYFDEAMALKAAQKSASREINALNAMIREDGAHDGVLSHYCRLARMKPEDAAQYLALEDFYRQALASRLPNPKTPAGAPVRPFEQRSAAA